MKKYILTVFLLISYIQISCTTSNNNEKKNEIPSTSINQFFNSNGVVSFKNTDRNIKMGFSIFNEDKTLFMKIIPASNMISFQNNELKASDFENKEYKEKYNFSPKEFWIESGFIIQFEFVKYGKDFIEIYIDKQKKIKKLLANNNSLFKIQTWEEHINGVIISFNSKKNIIRITPNDNSKSMGYEQYKGNNIFIVKRILGEWLQIECANICDSPTTNKFNGWIRWRENDKLLIRFAYTC